MSVGGYWNGSKPCDSWGMRWSPGGDGYGSKTNVKVRANATRETSCWHLYPELALTFSLASNSYRASSMLQTWRQVYLSHCSALSFAVQFHSVQLRYKILLSWRIQLRMKLKLIKQAKLAEKFFIFRKAWRVWMDRFDESMREKKLRLLRKQKLKKCFHCKHLAHWVV